MNAEEIRKYCLLKKEVTEGFPFDNQTLVFKVNNKMFALLSLEGPLRISLKCDPEKALELRERYPSVTPGYHLNKQQWNTIYFDSTIEDELIRQWIDDSYYLIIQKMPKKDRIRLLGE
jgi:predicted DNA-binding protein (MmcQ/YjbR family)